MEDKLDETIAKTETQGAENELSAGTILCKKYEIEKALGAGGMGTVYLVKQILLGKQYALKVVNSKKVSEVSLRRFQQEARMAASLKHPNLVEVHDFGLTEEHHPYLVMDFVEGESLAQVLKKKGTLNIERVVALSIQVAFGLLYAHENKVVHRDIKPGNIMLLHADAMTTEGSIKIVDFGIAKLVQSDEGEIQALTKTGEIFGSPLYMSPEQCKGSAVDARSDIYSLGCVIFECLTGSPPFWGDSAMTTMLKRLSEEPPTLKEGSLGKEFPPLMEKISKKCLSIDPENRYQTMSELVQNLALLQRQEADSESSPSFTKSKSEKQKFGLQKQHAITAAAVVLTGIGTMLIDRTWLSHERAPENAKEEKKVFDSTNLNESSRSALNKVLGDQSSGKFPSVEIRSDDQDKKWYVIHFPTDIGKIRIFPGGPWIAAKGDVLVPFDSEIELSLNKPASRNPKVLRDMSNLKFHKLEFSRSYMIENDILEPAGKIEHLKEIDLAGTEITSLKAFYGNPLLQALEVRDTKVSTDEILRIKRLRDLDMLGFGPVADPKRILDELAKTNAIRNLSYRGPLHMKARKDSHLTDDDIDSLAKLVFLKKVTIYSCPNFDDRQLEKLLVMKELREITARDCALTPASRTTFNQFPKLERVFITTEGWSESDKKEFLKSNFKTNFVRSKEKENNEKRVDIEGAVDLLN